MVSHGLPCLSLPALCNKRPEPLEYESAEEQQTQYQSQSVSDNFDQTHMIVFSLEAVQDAESLV